MTEDPETPPRIHPKSKLLAFPKERRFLGKETTVVVALVINADGRIRRNSINVIASPDSVMTDWACRAVSNLRFTAAQHQGRAVAAETTLPFTYRPAALPEL